MAKVGRPKKPEGAARTVAVRLPPNLYAAVEGEVERLAKAQPGFMPTVADAVRTLLVEALAARPTPRKGRK